MYAALALDCLLAVSDFGSTCFNIDEIAYECGFNSTSYFSYAFKKEFLVSPLKYRMRIND